MKLGVLYSGGKDSNLALYYASKHHNINVLLSLSPKSENSYLFHYPNINLVKLQSEALNIPVIIEETSDNEKDQVISLKKLFIKAKELFDIDGVVTGAVKSTYQASRFQKICMDLDLWCFNPLWLSSEEEILNNILNLGFKVIITRLAYENPDVSLLGEPITFETINYLKRLGINLAGEGGEYETFVLDSPMFKKKVVIDDYYIIKRKNEAMFIIKKAHLERK